MKKYQEETKATVEPGLFYFRVTKEKRQAKNSKSRTKMESQLSKGKKSFTEKLSTKRKAKGGGFYLEAAGKGE